MQKGKTSIYLDKETVDNLKTLVNNWYYYDDIRLTNMSQVIQALITEHKKNKSKNEVV